MSGNILGISLIPWWCEVNPRCSRGGAVRGRRQRHGRYGDALVDDGTDAGGRRVHADFSYQHHTITNGAVLYGGIESGWRDRRARHTLRAYAQKHVGAHRDRDPQTGLRTNWTTPDLRVRSCHVQEHVDGPFRPTYYVAPPHDATQAHRQRPPNFIAPFCGPGRRTALE